MIISSLHSISAGSDLDPVPHRVQLRLVDDPDTSFEAMTEREFEQQLECGLLDPDEDLEWDHQGDEGSPILVSPATTSHPCSSVWKLMFSVAALSFSFILFLLFSATLKFDVFNLLPLIFLFVCMCSRVEQWLPLVICAIH